MHFSFRPTFHFFPVFFFSDCLWKFCFWLFVICRLLWVRNKIKIIIFINTHNVQRFPQSLEIRSSLHCFSTGYKSIRFVISIRSWIKQSQRRYVEHSLFWGDLRLAKLKTSSGDEIECQQLILTGSGSSARIVGANWSNELKLWAWIEANCSFFCRTKVVFRLTSPGSLSRLSIRRSSIKLMDWFTDFLYQQVNGVMQLSHCPTLCLSSLLLTFEYLLCTYLTFHEK